MTESNVIKEKAVNIKLVVFDVDGVFTNGSIIVDADGNETKVFHVHDGHGIRMLMHYGVDVAVLSARESLAVTTRMEELGIQDILQGHQNKGLAFADLLQLKGLQEEQAAFVGDDIVDLQAMRLAGLSIAVANARDLVKEHADWVTTCSGGAGAVREVCELILDAKGLLQKAFQFNLQ